MRSIRNRSILAVLCVAGGNALSPITLTTKTALPDQSPEVVQNFLASPGNWPKIVSTSMGVASEENVDQPLKVGKNVDEIFGLPPIIPLSVTWTCNKSKLPTVKKGRFGGNSNSEDGRLEFLSPKGLEGVAENCEMLFDVQKQQSSTEGTEVVLNMRYQPVSPLAVLAAPILTIDNAIALQFLLPAAMRDQPELDKFRNLVGSLYLGAGLAHLADCLFGGSQLLATAGAPTFEMLPLVGQIYALLWCVMGPVSFALAKLGGKGYADIGLIMYGLVEIGGAGLIAATYAAAETSGMNPFINAVLVQAIVAGAWFYSANKAQTES